MTDREKVVMALTLCANGEPCMGEKYRTCPYSPIGKPEYYNCGAVMAADALALLKEQEKPDCEHAEHDGIGCLGYAGCTQDDEPINVCKTCREYTGNRCEEATGDD